MWVCNVALEEGQEMGSNLIEGYVRKFDDKTLARIWVELVVPCSDNLILKDFDNIEFLFFTFLFLMLKYDAVIAQTKYNNQYPSIICQEIFMAWCHPEKSHLAGLNFLKNFTRLS